jgi:hypothetical protein
VIAIVVVIASAIIAVVVVVTVVTFVVLNVVIVLVVRLSVSTSRRVSLRFGYLPSLCLTGSWPGRARLSVKHGFPLSAHSFPFG